MQHTGGNLSLEQRNAGEHDHDKPAAPYFLTTATRWSARHGCSRLTKLSLAASFCKCDACEFVGILPLEAPSVLIPNGILEPEVEYATDL